MIRRLILPLSLALLGLSQGAAAQARTGPAANGAAATPPDLRRVVRRPVVVYVEATAAELDSLRASLPADEFAVVADDLMFYRSTAIEYLQKRGAPFVRIEGRRPIVFRVAGKARRFDFADVHLLDFVVVYSGEAAPRIVAPNEIETIGAPLLRP